MDSLLIEGRYSTFENAEGKPSRPIEEKKDIREDASWSYFGFPGNIDTLEEQAKDIFIEHKRRKVILNKNDIFLKQLGFPTHPVTKALLYAETHHEVNKALRDTYGWTDWRSYFLLPGSFGDGSDIRRKPLIAMSDNELIKVAFKVFTNKYKDKLISTLKEGHFKQNTGNDLIIEEHTLTNWGDSFSTNKRALELALEKYIKEAYYYHRVVDVTPAIKENMIDFTGALFTMVDEATAFGGIQEVEVKGYLTDAKEIAWKPDFMGLHIELKITLKDWFGVDEEDVYKSANAAHIARDSLAALWILQHQRGYRPFMNIIKYKEQLTVLA